MCITACTKKEERTNPFFETWNTPYQVAPFEDITIDDYREALYKGMEEQNEEIRAIVNNGEEPTFENVIVAFDRSGSLLSKVQAIFAAQCGAAGSDEMRELESEIAPHITKHRDNIMMNEALFDKVNQVRSSIDLSILGDEEKTLLNELYLNFIAGGALLEGDNAIRFKDINEKLASLQNKFTQNITLETKDYKLHIEQEEDLAGLSADVIASAAKRAEDNGLEGWLFGLDNPSIMPFLASSENRKLRNEILTAYLNRCNNNNDQDNKDILKEIVVLRKEKANLLGYNDFADYTLERRMAKNTQNVYDLLDKLWKPALEKSKEERADMQKIAGKDFKLNASDWRFYSEKVKVEKYNISDEILRPYFKAENVRDGIFYVCNQLFGITFKENKEVPRANAETEVFVCYDNDGVTELGVLFIDLYARPGIKRVGAWCGSYRTAGQDENGNRILPLTYISCNFTPPIGDDPALLTPDETETFFHEFGHALHNLFKINKYRGTIGVPRDFVELPSQIMEHWAFEPQVLAQYAKHYQTGEVIPEELQKKMEASAKFGQGFITTEFLAAAILDMDYHINPEPQNIDVLNFEVETLNNKRGLISEIPPRYRSTYFNHTFSGSYAVGYYSYIWSEVLDADAYQAFVESGDIFNKEIAEKFRRCILQQGGIYPADQMYRDFRGKDPDFQALIKNRGLDK